MIRNHPNEPANAMLKLFSIVPDQVEFACRNYQASSRHTTGIVDDLIRMYRKEDMLIVKTIEDIVREVVLSLPAKTRIEGLTVEEILKVVSREELLKGAPLEERMKGFSRKELEAYLRQLPPETKCD